MPRRECPGARGADRTDARGASTESMTSPERWRSLRVSSWRSQCSCFRVPYSTGITPIATATRMSGTRINQYMPAMDFGRRARHLLSEWMQLVHSPDRASQPRGRDLSASCELVTESYTRQTSTRLVDHGFARRNPIVRAVQTRRPRDPRRRRARVHTPIDGARHPPERPSRSRPEDLAFRRYATMAGLARPATSRRVLRARCRVRRSDVVASHEGAQRQRPQLVLHVRMAHLRRDRHRCMVASHS